MALKDSPDENVSTPCKRSTVIAVTEAESGLRHKEIAGTVAAGRQGLVTS